jgi:hypothetical protein
MIRKYIINAAGRAFVQGASTPSLSLVTMISVRFAILPKLEKQMKKELEK